MALKQLMIQKKIEQRKSRLEELNKKTEELYKIGQKFTSNSHKNLLKQIKDNKQD